MPEKLILVNLDINVEGANVAASMENYTANVVEGMQIIWSITIKWPSISDLPSGEVIVEIPHFKNITPGNVDLFVNYTPVPIQMQQTAPGKPELSAVFASPIVQTSTQPPPPPFLWEWEYFIKLSLDTDAGLSHFKIDPLVVISG